MEEQVNIKIEQTENEKYYILKINDFVYKKRKPNPLKAFKMYSKLFAKSNEPEAITNMMADSLLQIEVEGFGLIETDENVEKIFVGDRIKHLPVLLEWATYRGLEDFLGENPYLKQWSIQFENNLNKR